MAASPKAVVTEPSMLPMSSSAASAAQTEAAAGPPTARGPSRSTSRPGAPSASACR
jgi:hypothetical protein